MFVMDEPNKKNGLGTIIQLKALSEIETNYLYGNESFFGSFNWKRPTNFYRESVVYQPPNVFSNFGEEVVFNIKPECDMIGDILLQFVLPPLQQSIDGCQTHVGWTNIIGYSLIESLKVVCSTQTLLETTGEMLYIENFLTQKQSKTNGYNTMIGKYNTKYSLYTNARSTTEYYVDIPLFKTEYNRQFFPIKNTMDKEIQIRIKLRKLQDVIYVNEDKHVSCSIVMVNGIPKVTLNDNISVKTTIGENVLMTRLHMDCITLEDSEKNHISQQVNEYIFKQYQMKQFDYKKGTSYGNMQLDFRFTVTHLVIVAKSLNDTDNNNYYNYLQFQSFKLILNGAEQHESPSSNYLKAGVYKMNNRHSHIPPNNIYIIPFAFNPNDSQPTGSFNFSESSKNLVSFKINVTSDFNVRVYAINSNILKASKDFRILFS
jgi:hypothetical protein